MNCKPGDIAVIVRDDPLNPSPLAGVLVDVLYVSPVGSFNLPDGCPARGEVNSWVIKFQRALTVRFGRGTRHAWYAGCGDKYLRPISGDGVSDDEVTELYRPAPAQPVKTGEPA